MGLNPLSHAPDAAAALRTLTAALTADPVANPPVAGRYNRVIDALNRLPRPLSALGALVLVAFAMIDPAGFAARMAALSDMPDPLWWLIGAVMTFTFGARETHYLRNKPSAPPKPDETAPNAALDDWQSGQP